MYNVGIDTTQNVRVEYNVASIGDRIVATLLDYLFFAAYFFLIYLLNSAFNFINGWGIGALISLPVLLYDLVLELLYDGQSYGKMIMKIKVVKIDGSRPGIGSYLLRWLFRIIDTRILAGVVAIVTILINGKGQRLGDIAAKTTVIKTTEKLSLRDTILGQVDEGYEVVFPQVAQLSDKDINIINEVLNYGLNTQNWKTIDQLADKVKQTMEVKTNLNNVQFLRTVVKDYTNYQFSE